MNNSRLLKPESNTGHYSGGSEFNNYELLAAFLNKSMKS